jgi:hypothetical protein
VAASRQASRVEPGNWSAQPVRQQASWAEPPAPPPPPCPEPEGTHRRRWRPAGPPPMSCCRAFLSAKSRWVAGGLCWVAARLPGASHCCRPGVLTQSSPTYWIASHTTVAAPAPLPPHPAPPRPLTPPPPRPRPAPAPRQVGKLSPGAQSVILRYTSGLSEFTPVAAWSAALSGALPWGPPEAADYEALLGESEYAAWWAGLGGGRLGA